MRSYLFKVNESKTKVVVFKNGGVLARHKSWTYRNAKLEIVKKFCYLGLLFTRQLSENAKVHELCVKGKRILNAMLKSLYNCGQLSNFCIF